MRKDLIFLVLAIACCLGFSATAPAQQTSEEASPLTTTVAVAPMVFETDGQRHLCYELYLTNMYPIPFTLQSIAANDAWRQNPADGRKQRSEQSAAASRRLA